MPREIQNFEWCTVSPEAAVRMREVIPRPFRGRAVVNSEDGDLNNLMIAVIQIGNVPLLRGPGLLPASSHSAESRASLTIEARADEAIVIEVWNVGNVEKRVQVGLIPVLGPV